MPKATRYISPYQRRGNCGKKGNISGRIQDGNSMAASIDASRKWLYEGTDRD
jgi:hypothetical protein